MATTKITTTNPATYAETDDGNTVYLESREPSYSGGRAQTVDIWTGTTDAIRELYTEFRTNQYAESLRIGQKGRKSTLTVTWSVDFVDGDTPEDDPTANSDTWSVRAFEIPTPLAAHPYFQLAYIPEAGNLLADEIARAESAIKRGRQFTASGAYADWVARYYALRMAGVEEWIQYGVEVTRRYKVFAQADAILASENAGLVLQAAAVGMPVGVLAVINNLPKIDSYTTSDPSTYQLVRSQFEFVVKPPVIGYSIDIDGNEVFDIEATYIGLQEWSAVIYPGGSWDPIGLTE